MQVQGDGSVVSAAVRRSGPRRAWPALAIVAALALFAGACSDDSDDAADATSTTAAAEDTTSTTAAVEELTILVTNDDGVDSPGLSAVVDALAALPDTEVVVAAPAEQQSGSGSSSTDGEVSATESETAGGVPAWAVDGFPADAVNWALDGGVDVEPDLVVSGINSAQNLGAVGNELSGTIGAARAGAAAGIPALAASSALNDAVDYDLAATYVVGWVEDNRDAVLDGELSGDDVVVINLNVPVCTAGELRGEIEVPMSEATEGAIADQDCTSTLADPTDDITAFNNGFVTISEISVEPPVTD